MKSRRVCLSTSEHVSQNPRLVKEADALQEAGFDVRVVACQWDEDARRLDEALMATRRWRLNLVRWDRARGTALFWSSRLRHRAVRSLPGPLPRLPGMAERAVARVAPELARATAVEAADLFIGHEPGGLAAAARAARRHGAALGFDAEDFHSAMSGEPADGSRASAVTRLERRYLPRCDYVTASSEGIAEAYAERYGIPRPVAVLNVFPLAHRPDHLRRPGPASLSLYWFSQTVGHGRGLEDVVAAMGKIGRRDIVLHVRGRWQEGYREELHRRVAEAGLAQDQVVAHAPEPPDEMVRLSAAHDVGLVLEIPDSRSRDLCIANKLFTYLLAGNAIVATRTRGHMEVLEQVNGAGSAYRPGDVDGLADRLRLWHEDRALLARARAAAWEWGTRRYNWDLEKGRFLNAVESVLGRR